MCCEGAGITLKSEQERVTLCRAFGIRVGDKHFAALTEEPWHCQEAAASATKVRILCLVQLSVEAKATKMC